MCKNSNACILPVVIAVILGVVIGALFLAGTITAEGQCLGGQSADAGASLDEHRQRH